VPHSGERNLSQAQHFDDHYAVAFAPSCQACSASPADAFERIHHNGIIVSQSVVIRWIEAVRRCAVQ
jgi:hypothetical protein